VGGKREELLRLSQISGFTNEQIIETSSPNNRKKPLGGGRLDKSLPQKKSHGKGGKSWEEITREQ